MAPFDLGGALRAAQVAGPEALTHVLSNLAHAGGASDLVVYLADFGQTTLEPLPDRGAHVLPPGVEEITATMAGRAFIDQRAHRTVRAGGVRVWVPVVEGSDRTGVLALTVPDATAEVVAWCEELGLLAGLLIATHARTTDFFDLHRRQRSLSLAATMQWDLLPPLVLKTAEVTVAALLQPAYDVGGDCFDYALNGPVLDLAIMDPVGHGIESALLASLALGCYRHGRREHRDLAGLHVALDATIAEQFPRAAFVTGQLARLDVTSGRLSWSNAGHPPPLLLRNGVSIGEMSCPPTVPWGVGGGDARPAVVVTAALEPGDAVLFHTDGMTEAHRPGEPPFGVERLADMAGQHVSNHLEPEEIVRRLVHAVLDYQHDALFDDATVLLLRWNGPPGATTAR